MTPRGRATSPDPSRFREGVATFALGIATGIFVVVVLGLLVCTIGSPVQ